jgi:hypothetical protein
VNFCLKDSLFLSSNSILGGPANRASALGSFAKCSGGTVLIYRVQVIQESGVKLEA